MTLEEDAIGNWLVDYLDSDSTIMGLTNGETALHASWKTNPSPFVRIDVLDPGADLLVIGLHRVWVDQTYHVRGVVHWTGLGKPDRTDVEEIGARIDELLHDHEANINGFQIHSFREEPTPQPAVTFPTGELWLQSGGVYRIRANAAS